jgi:hypothetical protein
VGEELPLLVESAKKVLSSIEEFDPRTHDKVFDGARDQDLTGASFAHHPGCGVNGDAADVVTSQFDLAYV